MSNITTSKPHLIRQLKRANKKIRELKGQEHLQQTQAHKPRRRRRSTTPGDKKYLGAPVFTKALEDFCRKSPPSVPRLILTTARFRTAFGSPLFRRGVMLFPTRSITRVDLVAALLDQGLSYTERVWIVNTNYKNFLTKQAFESRPISEFHIRRVSAEYFRLMFYNRNYEQRHINGAHYALINRLLHVDQLSYIGLQYTDFACTEQNNVPPAYWNLEL